MLEFDQPAEMRVASLSVLELIQRKACDLQDIDAGKSRIWFGRQYTAHRERERLAKRFVTRFEVNCRQYDRRIGKVGCQRTVLP